MSKWQVMYAQRSGKQKKPRKDGFLVRKNNKLLLMDLENKHLDEKFVGPYSALEEGLDLEFDRYYVEVGTCTTASNNPEQGTYTYNDASQKCSESSVPAVKRFKTERGSYTCNDSPKCGSSVQRRSTEDILQRLKRENRNSLQQTSSASSRSNASFEKPISSNFQAAKFKMDRSAPVQVRFLTGQPHRNVNIPDKFKDLSHYKGIMSSALVEEICLIVTGFANAFKAAKEKVYSEQGRSIEELEQAYGKHDINLFGSCESVKRSAKPGYISIRLGRASGSLKYEKGDLMVISSSSSFPEDTSASEFTVVTTTNAYGSSKNAVIELRLHGEPVPLKEGKMIYVLQGPNIRSELMMLDCIRGMEVSSTPLLPLLIGSQSYVYKDITLPSDISRAAERAILKYRLNLDQAIVLRRVSGWFTYQNADIPHVCLVHGPFGSGKSQLLVALIIFLSEILKERGDSTTRFVIASATNSAVDRVLTGLLEHGFEDFLRVGSLRKIASNILPYSVHVAAPGDEDAAENDLKELMKESLGSERLKIENELKALNSGKTIARRKMLQKVRAVGVTCSSTINDVLQGNTFKVCFLDECSQILEPLSLLPICKFRCEKLIAVGDPEQLPPVLIQTEKQNIGSKSENLSRTLFVRLAALGHKPVLLRTQYRCHPRLARLPNRLFYGGYLLDGCSDVERSALLPGLPPLIFFDTGKNGKEKKDIPSFSNPYEAEIVCSIIDTLLSRGISGNRIGVITLYKSQETFIRQKLYPDDAQRRTKKSTVQSEVENVKVSTVDAFQGLEKDIILLSCCRTSGLGFTTCRNRLNVALTRARHHLIIIGSATNLQRSAIWEELLDHVRRAKWLKNTEEIKKVLECKDEEMCTSSLVHVPMVHEETPMHIKEVNCVLEDTLLACEKSLPPRMQEILDSVDFRPRDFYEGYKHYCIGYYSRSEVHQDCFLRTVMADVVRKAYNEEEFRWGAKFDEIMRSSWCAMEDYVKHKHGVDCADIRKLVQVYDDPKQLAATEYGSIFLQMCQDEHVITPKDEEKKGEESGLFEGIMGRLSSMDERLDKLTRRTSVTPHKPR